MLYIDLSELPALFDPFIFWSARRPAVAWFRRDDHLGDPTLTLAESVRDLVESRLGVRPSGRICLLTHLRYFGYHMNPVSFYYCYDDDDESLTHVVAEVNNTPWGEQYAYVVDPVSCGTARPFKVQKEFHVSPFMSMQQHYEWSFSEPQDNLFVNMASYEQGNKVFSARLELESQRINAKTLSAALFSYPVMTMKVALAIYWQALRLWRRGVPFYAHPNNIKHGQS